MWKPNGWRIWLAALTLSALLLLSQSCASCPPHGSAEIPLDWPTFPDPMGQVTLDGEAVTMPLSYWLAVAEYAVAVDRVRGVVGETIER